MTIPEAKIQPVDNICKANNFHNNFISTYLEKKGEKKLTAISKIKDEKISVMGVRRETSSMCPNRFYQVQVTTGSIFSPVFKGAKNNPIPPKVFFFCTVSKFPL